jgi:hypothetical protein
MSGFSTYLAQAVLNHVLRGAAYTPPAGTYLALAVADITDDNVTANEVTGAWYARQQVTSWAAPVGSGVSTSNSNAMAYSAITGSAVSVTHWGLYDAATSGNLLACGVFTDAKVGNVNNRLRVAAGEIALSFDGIMSIHLAQKLINFILRGQAFTPPTPYIALYDADPTTADVTANEVDAAWYARQAMASWDAPTGTGNSTANSEAFTFPEVTGASITVTHWGLKDAVSGGNLLCAKALPLAEILNIGDAFAGAAGDLSTSLL